MGFSDFLGSLIGNTPSNRAAETINIARANQSRMLEDEYARAQADPNSGIGLSPAMQQMQENELANSVRSRMSDAGAGRSGAANDSVQNAIVEYRIAQMAKRQQYLDQLRQGMLTSSTPQTVTNTAPQNMVGGFAGRAGQGVASDLFGFDEDEQRRQGGMNVQPAPVAQPSGYDPRGRSADGYRTNGGDHGAPGGV